MATLDISPQNPTKLADVDEKQDVAHFPNSAADKAGLSENQQTLVEAAIREKSRNLGTFTAIKYYWVAFLWAQFAAFGTILTGYDGTVSQPLLLRLRIMLKPAGHRCGVVRADFPVDPRRSHRWAIHRQRELAGA